MKKFLPLFILACFFGNTFSQVTVDIIPDKDNSIFSESNNSNGTGALFSGPTCDGFFRRALLHFDIAGNIPAGATITAVTLTMNVQTAGSNSTSENYNLHPVTIDWGEGTSFGIGSGGAAVFPDATWNQAVLSTTAWTTPGGDFGASVATTNLTAATGDYDWSSPGMLANVQNWLTTPATNFGWILIGDESTTCTARRFGSKEVGIDPVLSITYTCATPPTATCQNTVVYLGSNGQYTLDPEELDGGSISNCGGPLTFSASQTHFDCTYIGPYAGSLILTAVFDGNLTGGLPKGVELFVRNNIPDLSIYGLGSATNGGGSDGQEFTFPAVSATAGTYIYVASESIGFTNFFGFAPDYVDSDMGVNGDDAIELFENGTVIDVFGDITWVGAQPWFYSDGFAYRNNNTGPDGSTFVSSNWTFSGIDALDPAVTNGTAPVPVPIETYTMSAMIPVTLTVTDAFSNMSTCNTFVIVFDTLAPSIHCIPPTTFDLDLSGNLTLTPLDIDNITTDGCDIQTMTISQSNFDCSDVGLNQITLTAIDIYGNQSECVADVTIQPLGGLIITEDVVSNVTCNGNSDGEISITITGGAPTYIIDWDNDGTGDNDDTEDLSGLDEGTYSLSIIDQNGCTAQHVVVITEPDVLAASFVVDDISCFGETDGAIDMTVSGGTGAYTFDWDNDGTGDNDDTEDLNGIVAGDYDVIISDANLCTAAYSITVLNATPINVSVTVTGVSLMSNSTGTNYQWIECPANTIVLGATNATFNATVDGDYAVIVTDGNGCSDTSACFTILGLSINDNTISTFEIYPNPANSFINLTNANFSSEYNVTVSDLNGRIILNQTITSANETIDISGLSEGVYFLTAYLNGDTKINRFVVTR